MAVSAPDRTHEQRMASLAKANEIRRCRKLLKMNLKGDRVKVAPLIKNPPEYIETMKIMELILAVPRLGKRKTSRMLIDSKISHSKTVGGLSKRQREVLVAKLQRLNY